MSLTRTSGLSAPETRLSRLKKGIDLLNRLAASAGTGNQAFRNALLGLSELLSSAREDLAQAERFVSPDLAELLEQKGVEREARAKLLEHFDELAPIQRLPLQRLEESPSDGKEERVKQEVTLNCSESHLVRLGDGTCFVSMEVFDSRPCFLLSGASLNKEHSLAAVGELLLLPAVLEAAGTDAGKPVESFHVPMKSRHCALGPAGGCSPVAWRPSFGLVLMRSSVSHEARAALTLRATSWLAKEIGLWTHLDPWERVALVTAAAGLHVPAGGGKAVSFKPDSGTICEEDPLSKPHKELERAVGCKAWCCSELIVNLLGTCGGRVG